MTSWHAPMRTCSSEHTVSTTMKALAAVSASQSMCVEEPTAVCGCHILNTTRRNVARASTALDPLSASICAFASATCRCVCSSRWVKPSAATISSYATGEAGKIFAHATMRPLWSRASEPPMFALAPAAAPLSEPRSLPADPPCPCPNPNPSPAPAPCANPCPCRCPCPCCPAPAPAVTLIPALPP